MGGAVKAKWPSIGKDPLTALHDEGLWSDVLEARLAFASVNQVLTHHIRPLRGYDLVHPNMMGPQSSGRMSVSDPPLINFTADKKYGPDGIRDVVGPKPGQKWAACDWEAIEARFVSHASRDEGDNEAFAKGWDIHSTTAQRMFHWPEFTFEPTKKMIFKSDAGMEWCLRVGHIIHGQGCRKTTHAGCQIDAYHDDHRMRRLAKNCRYALQYAFNEKAMARYSIEMKIPKEELWRVGKLYLLSKPVLVAWKKRTWADCWRTHEARTFMGRRRRLLGTRDEVMKEGLNHIIQGSVADMMKTTLCLVLDPRPTWLLGFQSHDGFKFVIPRNEPFDPAVKKIVAREVIAWGRPINFPASWKMIFPPDEPGEEQI